MISSIPGVKLFGLKGAALAALGERPGVFEGVLLPFADSDAGVKLGESTLKRFLMLKRIPFCYRWLALSWDSYMLIPLSLSLRCDRFKRRSMVIASFKEC